MSHGSSGGGLFPDAPLFSNGGESAGGETELTNGGRNATAAGAAYTREVGDFRRDAPSTSSNPGLVDHAEQWARRLAEFKLADDDALQALERALLDARRGRLDQPPPPTLTVLLLGASGAGKSELLNALAGERIATSHHVRPTTRRPTIYAHASLSPERLYDYGPVLGDLAKQPGAYRTHRREELLHKIIIDAPDIDSYETAHRQLVLDLLPAVDVALYVTTPYNYKDDVGWQVVLQERGRRAFAFVLNKWDSDGKPKVIPGARDVDEDLRSLLEQGGWAEPLIFRTSARFWVAQRAGVFPESTESGAFGENARPARPMGDTPPEGDQLPVLERWLTAGLSTSQVEQIQRRRRRSLWGQLSAAVNAALSADMSDWARSADAEAQALRQDTLQLLMPAIEARAQGLAAVRDGTRRPESPGPFGIMQRMVSGISGLGRRRNSIAARALTGNLNTDVPGVTDHAGGVQTLAFQVTDSGVRLPSVHHFLQRRLERLEWRARESRLPVRWVTEVWGSAITNVDAELQDAADSAAAELSARDTGKMRSRLAAFATFLAELAMLGVIGLAGWRLATGFFVGQYLSLGFIGNLFALLLCVFLLGQFVVGLLLPRSESLFRRGIEARIRKVWDEQWQSAIRSPLQVLSDQAAVARKDGLELVRHCAAETQRLTNEISAAGHGAAEPTDQLFGTYGTAEVGAAAQVG